MINRGILNLDLKKTYSKIILGTALKLLPTCLALIIEKLKKLVNDKKY